MPKELSASDKDFVEKRPRKKGPIFRRVGVGGLASQKKSNDPPGPKAFGQNR